MSSIRRPINTRAARATRIEQRTFAPEPKADPTADYQNQPYHKLDLRHREWNDHEPPRDPVKVAKAEGRRHTNQATGATLFHDNVIPVGEHCGKTLRQVPAVDLLRYGSASAFRSWPEWSSVIDYVERHLAEIKARAANEGPAAPRCTKHGYTKRDADTAVNARTHGLGLQP